MKKLNMLGMFLLLLMTMPLVMSCGDDDEGSGNEADSNLINKAIGTWMCTQSTDKGQGQTYDGLMVGKEVTINADGTYTSTAQSFGYTGNYTVSGNKITARSNNGSTFVITVSIKGDQMTWDGTASNGVTFKYIFVREDDDVSQSYIPIRNDMIAGSSWEVKSFTIARGSNSDLQNGKTIRFNEDGSCEVFNSMETAWRINNGRIETFYKQTNEPMFVYTLLSQTGDDVKIQMNGTLDDELQATIELTKKLIVDNPTSITDESFWNTKENVYAIRNSSYAACATFEKEQLNLEKIRTNTNTVHNISPNSNEVKRTWEAAYTTINGVNYLMDHINQFSSHFNEQELNELMAEVRFIRAFVYYNLATLWGQVPLVTTASVDAGTTYSQSNKGVVLSFALREVMEIIGNLKQTTDKCYVSYEAGQLLLSELYLQTGNSMSAKSALNKIDRQKYEGYITSTDNGIEKPVIWALNISTDGKHIPVYTYSHILFYEKEINRNVEELTTEWKSTAFADYGYWTMLTRTGEAQSVTGCYDYELLMPFPVSEIMNNPNMTQNPGY